MHVYQLPRDIQLSRDTSVNTASDVSLCTGLHSGWFLNRIERYLNQFFYRKVRFIPEPRGDRELTVWLYKTIL